jgi:hypothetical protein
MEYDLLGASHCQVCQMMDVEESPVPDAIATAALGGA